ncbi:putative MFS family arabinose efflux permease [Azorhizobium sp. AG788]|uniref:arabinose transporter n=1 Tax=Azorhizobium sp. AG788 TaxID=2183897 RepID=UPI001060D38E|nr:arabinose transporter [Azorhizobium sp. AG788]TDT93384.1 putative MFS family arabinose efflux permease [Azorhizobium sp. AG788]
MHAPPKPRASSALFAVVPILFPLTLSAFLAVLSIGIPLPVLSIRVHEGLGFGAVLVGVVVGSQSVVTLLSRGMAGTTVDSHGAKWAVVAGLPLAACAGGLYLASLALPDPSLSLAVLIAGRMIHGIAESLFITGFLAWGIGRVGVAKAGLVMGWNGIAVSAALAVGAPLGVVAQESYGFGAVALLALAAPLLAMAIVVCVAAVPRSEAPAAPRLPFVRVLGLVWRFGLVLALSTAPFALLGSFVVLTFTERGWAHAGLALSLYGIGFVLVRFAFGHMPDRLGGATVSLISLAVEGVGQALLFAGGYGGFDHVWVGLAGAALTGAGFSLVLPAMGVEAVRRVPRESQGAAIGSFMAFLDIALGVTGPLAGLLAGVAGFGSVFGAGALACIVAIGLVLAMGRRTAS